MTSVESKDCSVSHRISYFLIGLFSDISYFQLFASLVAQTVKRLPAMWETQVWSLGQEDPLEKEMATHSSTLPWKIPWTEEPGRLQSMGSQRVRHYWATWLSFPFLSSLIFRTWVHQSNLWLLARDSGKRYVLGKSALDTDWELKDLAATSVAIHLWTGGERIHKLI